MGIFQNEVGRPSNETLKKRRLIIGGGIALAFILVFGLVALVGGGSESGGLTTAITNTGDAKDSKLVISSRKVGSGLFKKREYYVDFSKSVNIPEENLFMWYMDPVLGGVRNASMYNYSTMTPARLLATYFCYGNDVYGNRIKSNSLTYLGI